MTGHMAGYEGEEKEDRGGAEQMMERIVILLTILIGGGISLALLMGKGAFLIAGYNTASEKEKRKYNEKKLCRTTGTYLALITVLVLGAEIMGEDIPDWYLALTMGGVFIGLIPTLLYANLGCRIKPGEEILLEKSPGKELKRKRTRNIGTAVIVLITIAAIVFSAVLLFTGDVKVLIQDGQLEIRGSYWSDYKLPLSEIQTVAYREDFETGRKRMGVNSLQLNEGTFQNKEFGEYTIYSYARCEDFVVLETTDGKLVINGKTPEETRELYEKILAAAGLE